MSDRIILEANTAGEWCLITELSPGEPLGSVSSDEPDGRQIIIFGWVDKHPYVWRSPGGVDIQIGRARIISPEQELVLLADLTVGPFAILINRPKTGPAELRWRLEET